MSNTDYPAQFGSEPPVIALATVVQARSKTFYQLSLPNGKLIHGHIPGRLVNELQSLAPGETVRVEMTPYDFERARITARIAAEIADGSEAFESSFV